MDGLVGHHPDIFLDVLQAPSPSWESISAFPPPLRDFATLLTRSWNEQEQNFLVEMPVGKVIIFAQLHSHRSVLYMMSMAKKVNSLWAVRIRFSICSVGPIIFFLGVKVELDKMQAKEQAMGLYESMEAERPRFATKER